MIVVVCGPSGSGKTTVIARLAQCPNCSVLPVTVARSRPRRDKELAKNEVGIDEFKRLSATFQFTYEYEESSYGFSLPQDISCAIDYQLLDYPGDYPTCRELQSLLWCGLLVLPPSRTSLLQRLQELGKESRVLSAANEYGECLRELSVGLYREPKWRVYVSWSSDALEDLASKASKAALFSDGAIAS